jgi:transcriptional regulator with GAF, ATPase, and Fis domain
VRYGWHGFSFILLVDGGKQMDTLTDKVKEIEKEEIINALKECRWIMSRAARKLGITERMIGYKTKKYKIRKEEVKYIEDDPMNN